MATIVNTNSRKRKSASDLIFEVTENDCSPSTSPVPPKECVSLSISETETSQTSIGNNHTSKRKMSKLDVDLRCMDMDVDSPSANKPFITFIFRDEDITNKYKTQIVKFIKSLVNVELNEESQSKFEISLWEKTIDVVDIPHPEPQLDNLFTVDTTPAKRNEYSPRYFPKFCSAIDDKVPEQIDVVQIDRPPCFSGTCFNCDGNHSLRDCKIAKNYKRINSARSRYQANAPQKVVRYHLDEEQKYSELVPGKISDSLRRALNVRRNEIPPYIYRMRELGYPPGWLQEAINQNSKLEIFDFDGSIRNADKAVKVVDPDKIIEYPGFNVPLQNGFRDEYRYFKCPQYSEEQSKDAMIRYIDTMVGQEQQQRQQQRQQLIDTRKTVTSTTTAPTPPTPPTTKQVPGIESDSNSQSSEVAERSSSPTLKDLEQRKKQLLLELANGGLLDSPQASQDSSGVSTPKHSNTPTQQETSPSIMSSIFGTPVIKSSSPFARLPNRDNFSQQISQVINFENLPNSTGKYEQMNQVITKVRGVVRSISDESKS